MKYNKIYLVIFFSLSLIILLCGIVYSSSSLYYYVRNGDTLTEIANYFNADLSKIISENNIKNPDKIKIGQKLLIPSSNNIYVVKAGDNLTKIAKTHNISLNNILKVNALADKNKIIPGQKIIIPTQENRQLQLTSRRLRNSLIWPVTEGQITCGFGWRTHPIKKEKSFHNGIDIAIPSGTEVYSVSAGKILFSGYANSYGYLVIIEHDNNILSYYAHNHKLLVKKDQTVHQGQLIALSGNSGLSTGPHLHFEIRVNNTAVDPFDYYDRNKIKL